MSDITYAYCIENLRYIHKIIGIDLLIKEAMFIDHLSKSSSNIEYIQSAQLSDFTETIPIQSAQLSDFTDTIPAIESASNSEIVPEKVIIINPQKYIRTVLSDEYKCECVTNNGQRCTLKKSKDSKYCSRHKTKMS
jgi:hypothetical protein